MSFIFIYVFVFFTLDHTKSTELIRYRYGASDIDCSGLLIAEERINLIKNGDVKLTDIDNNECFPEGGWTCERINVDSVLDRETIANEFTSCEWGNTSNCECLGYEHKMEELKGCKFGLDAYQIIGITICGIIVCGVCLFVCIIAFFFVLGVFVLPIFMTCVCWVVYKPTKKLTNDDKELPAMVTFPSDNNKDIPAMVTFPTDNIDEEMIRIPINYDNTNEGEVSYQKKTQSKDASSSDKEVSSSDEEPEY